MGRFWLEISGLPYHLYLARDLDPLLIRNEFDGLQLRAGLVGLILDISDVLGRF